MNMNTNKPNFKTTPTPEFVLLHRLSIQHTGAHTPSNLDSKKWHGITADGEAHDITEFEAQQHIDEGMEVLSGTVTRPFHSFYGNDLSDAIAAATKKG